MTNSERTVINSLIQSMKGMLNSLEIAIAASGSQENVELKYQESTRDYDKYLDEEAERELERILTPPKDDRQFMEDPNAGMEGSGYQQFSPPTIPKMPGMTTPIGDELSEHLLSLRGRMEMERAFNDNLRQAQDTDE